MKEDLTAYMKIANISIIAKNSKLITPEFLTLEEATMYLVDKKTNKKSPVPKNGSKQKKFINTTDKYILITIQNIVSAAVDAKSKWREIIKLLGAEDRAELECDNFIIPHIESIFNRKKPDFVKQITRVIMNFVYKIAYWDALHRIHEGKAMTSGVFFIIMLAMIPMEFHEEVLSAQNKVKSLKLEAVAKLAQLRKEKGEREEKENEIISTNGGSADDFGDDDFTPKKKSVAPKKLAKLDPAEEDAGELSDAF